MHINHRKYLQGLLEQNGVDSTNLEEALRIIDKLDKVSVEKTAKDLCESTSISLDQAKGLLKHLQKTVPICELDDYLANTDGEEGSLLEQGKAELKTIAALLATTPDRVGKIDIKPSIARGLDYYTGLIFEGVIPGNESSSIGGGGRYDNLIEQLGGPDIPSVGFAIGFDRTIEVLEEIGKLPKFGSISQVLVTVFDQSTAKKSAIVATTLRNAGISTELYPNVDDKLSKQLKYINDQKIRYAIIIGPDEIKNEIVTLKNKETGEEIEDKIEIIIGLISN